MGSLNLDRSNGSIPDRRQTKGGEYRVVEVRLSEREYASLISAARTAGRTPSAHILIQYLQPHPAKPACTEGEAIVATATKQLEREASVLKDELARAEAEIARLREAAKGQLVVVNAAKAAMAERDGARQTVAEHEATITRLTRLLQAHDAPPVSRPVVPQPEPVAPPAPPEPPVLVLTAKRRKEIRQWLSFGMNRAEVAKSLGVTVADLEAALQEAL
jgi:ribosomal protein L34E